MLSIWSPFTEQEVRPPLSRGGEEAFPSLPPRMPPFAEQAARSNRKEREEENLLRPGREALLSDGPRRAVHRQHGPVPQWPAREPRGHDGRRCKVKVKDGMVFNVQYADKSSPNMAQFQSGGLLGLEIKEVAGHVVVRNVP